MVNKPGKEGLAHVLKTKQEGEVFAISVPTKVQLPAAAVNMQDDFSQPVSDFETAVEATGYGFFNYLLIWALIPGSWAVYFNVTKASYLLPSVECDLNMTLNQKGVLNAAAFAGMIASAFPWGILAGTRGRRSLLMYGYMADFVCSVLSSMSQSYYFLVVLIFINGFIISGPFAIATTFLAEFTSAKHRPVAFYWLALLTVLSNMIIPGLAWAIIPQSWSFAILNGSFVYNSWRIFTLACSIPSLMAFLSLLYFSDSPKYLMSQDRNEEALKVFRRMYAMNTGKPIETFPIQILGQDVDIKKQMAHSDAKKNDTSLWEKTRSSWAEIKPLFSKPYLGPFIRVVLVQFGSILTLNTLRLWLPQLFTFIENFHSENQIDGSVKVGSLCDMISINVSPNATTVTEGFNSTIINVCVIPPVPNAVYTNSIIVAIVTIMCYILAGNVVNVVGRKTILLTSFAAPAVFIFALNWSPDSDVTLAIFSFCMAFMSISTTTIVSIVVDVVPTTLRTMAVSLTMCVGRSGAMLGNLLFPMLLTSGCMAPFIFIGGFLIFCFALTISIPKRSETQT